MLKFQIQKSHRRFRWHTFLLICFLMVAYLQGKAQNPYVPYPENYAGALWVYATFGGSQNETRVQSTWNAKYTVNGQTYIQSAFGGLVEGGFRQDIPNEKLYFLDSDNVEHDLTIDQNPNIGDTLIMDSIKVKAFFHLEDIYNPGPDTLQVADIHANGDILYVDSSYSADFFHLTFRPGVGFYSANGFEKVIAMDCFTNQGELQIGDPNDPACDPLTVQEFLPTDFAIYPNPVQDAFTVDLHQNSRPFSIELFDVVGHKVLQLTGAGRVQVNTAALRPGIYWVSVNQDQQRISKKVVIY